MALLPVRYDDRIRPDPRLRLAFEFYCEGCSMFELSLKIGVPTDVLTRWEQEHDWVSRKKAIEQRRREKQKQENDADELTPDLESKLKPIVRKLAKQVYETVEELTPSESVKALRDVGEMSAKLSGEWKEKTEVTVQHSVFVELLRREPRKEAATGFEELEGQYRVIE